MSFVPNVWYKSMYRRGRVIMGKRYASRLAVLTLSCLVALSVAGCAGGGSSSGSNQENRKITLNLFSDLPDRTTGQGLLEQTLISSYEKANPDVTIKVEALQDTPYKEKFKAYTSSNSLPDIFMVWGQPSFFQAVMQGGYAAELNKSDYDSDKFLKGSLDGFSLNGKLYGLPRNTDYMVLYYNKKILQQNGLSAPKSTGDFLTYAKKLNNTGIAAVSIGGGDKWPLAYLFNEIAIKQTGSSSAIKTAVTNKNFNTPELLKAATYLQTLAKDGIFQKSYLTDDTGAAMNVFGQGKAAMYYSGEWDMGMATSASFSDDLKNNLAVQAFPVTPEGAGKSTDIMAWNGGGYAVSAKSKNQDAAKKFLNYMMKPENWTKIGWQQGGVVPAQQFSSFMTGKENSVQKSLVDILNGASSLSGTGISDLGSSSFKTDSETAAQELCAGQLTPQQFLSALNTAIGQ